jgi:hypothetical protein
MSILRIKIIVVSSGVRQIFEAKAQNSFCPTQLLPKTAFAQTAFAQTGSAP